MRTWPRDNRFGHGKWPTWLVNWPDRRLNSAALTRVLSLFEGVVTGAADGYWRMTGKPAATLLHLGPGLGNGLANLHNAKKANSGIVNIVGEHATYHIKYDAPLTADIEGIARPVSHWVKTSTDATAVAADDITDLYANRAGIPFIIGGHMNVVTETVKVLDAIFFSL